MFVEEQEPEWPEWSESGGREVGELRMSMVYRPYTWPCGPWSCPWFLTLNEMEVTEEFLSWKV